MTLARTRLMVAVLGAVVLAAIVAGLLAVGGPDSGRRDRRDAARLGALRQIADALTCHAAAHAEPAEPRSLEAIAPDCLAADAAADLVDPRTRAAFRIGYPAPRRVEICADFEAAVPPSRAGGWPPFDATTGCVTASLVPR